MDSVPVHEAERIYEIGHPMSRVQTLAEHFDRESPGLTGRSWL